MEVNTKPIAAALLLAAALFMTAVGQAPLAAPAWAQGAERIAAVVNEDVISMHDLENRIKLMMVTTNLPDRPEVRQRLAGDVLRALIDDRLKMQEARRLNVVVSQKDIDNAVEQIENQSRLPPGSLAQFLDSRGVEIAELIGQIEAELAWAKAVNQLEDSRNDITGEDIDQELARIASSAGKPEYDVAEIFLPFEDINDESSTRQMAERMVDQIRGGASFQALARNFSRGSTAQTGGGLGWVQQGQLGTEHEKALADMQPGEISQPIRAGAGYYILALIDRRIAGALPGSTTEVSLYQLHLPVPPGATEEQIRARMREASDLGAGATNCADFEAIAKRSGSPLSGDLGTVALSRMAPVMQQAVAPLSVGQVSEPIGSGEGVIVVMVCDRQESAPETQRLRQMIARNLREERLSTASQRYLRDLRRSAFVDVRI